MFRVALFVAGCVVGYVASGYIDGFLEEVCERSESPSTERVEARS